MDRTNFLVANGGYKVLFANEAAQFGEQIQMAAIIVRTDQKKEIGQLPARAAKLSRLISEEDFVTTIRHEEIGAIHDLFVEAEEKLWN